MSAIHADETTLMRSVLGDLPERRQASLKRHLARCRPCRRERERTKRLHERLSAAGESLAFAPGDAFVARPIPCATGAAVGPLVEAMARALGSLEQEKAALRAAVEEDSSKAGEALNVHQAAVRLAAAHVLEESVTRDPSKEFAAFAGAIAGRLSEEPAEGDGDAVVPRFHLAALARLVGGNWLLFCGRRDEAGEEFAAAWAALGEFEAPEHLVAWVEAGESLRRSYEGRPIEARLMAERALATFERYGLDRGALRARHARAVALYTAGAFREAHREFRAAIGSKCATALDRARAVSGAAFCLAARGQFHEAAREYSRVRRRLKGEGAQVEQYLLQGEMKVALGTAGRWRPRRDARAAFALPEAGGAFHARETSAQILAVAGEQGIDAAKARLDAIEANPARGYALLYTVQVAMPKVSSDPAMYVELGKAIEAASRSLSFLKDKDAAQAICRGQVMGEAQLLESNALNYLGKCAEARTVAQQARVRFVEAGEDTFALAVADYYEGSAASFEGHWTPAWKLLKRSLEEFRAFALEGWSGKTEAALGNLLVNRDRNRSALTFYERALHTLHPVFDEAAYAITLTNKAFCFLQLDELDKARVTYARALTLVRRLSLTVITLGIRYGLAGIEIKRGRIRKALDSFERIAQDARLEGLEQRVLTARLRVAECLGRLGQPERMLTEVHALRRTIPGFSVECEVPLRELFAQADAADVSSEHVAHVVEYLEARDRGVQEPYRPFKLVRGEG